MSSQKMGSREEKRAKLKVIGDQLGEYTQEGELYEKLPDGKLRCFACGHRCPIPEGRAGVCKVRFNHGGKLLVPYGYVAALQDDPWLTTRSLGAGAYRRLLIIPEGDRKRKDEARPEPSGKPETKEQK